VLGLHATPIHSGWIEPLPILAGQSPLAAFPPAPGSHSRCPSGTASVFHRRSDSRRSAFTLTDPEARCGPLCEPFAVAAPRRTEVCTLPLPVGLGQNLLAAILASTRSPPPFVPGWALLSAGLTPRSGAPALVLTDPKLARAFSAVSAVAALHVLRSARYPCPLRQDRAPWPPSLLRQAPTRGASGFPAFPRG